MYPPLLNKENLEALIMLCGAVGEFTDNAGVSRGSYWSINVTGSGKRAHLAQVINFQFIALSERTHYVLSNAL